MSHRERLKQLNQVTTGWLAYYSKADSKARISRIDAWLRRRLRCGIWKEWKKVRTRIRNLQGLGVEKGQAYEWGNTRKGYWRISGSPVIQRTITNEKLRQSGYKSLLEMYIHFHENLSNRRGTRTVCQVV